MPDAPHHAQPDPDPRTPQLLPSTKSTPLAPAIIEAWLLSSVAHGSFVPSTFAAPAAARAFVASTFRVIYSSNLAATAAAFTFGREDVIPDIFRNLVRDLHTSNAAELSKFVWYLDRHIEVDGEDHGPLSLRMVADLCGNDDARWEQATFAAQSALQARLHLWDGILSEINPEP
jgi:pyrroloquinoline quinone (PQQ) biosynthesis protein C